MEEEVTQTKTFCELLNTGCSNTVTTPDVEKGLEKAGLEKAAEDVTGKLLEICTEPGLYRRRTQSTVRFCRSPPNIRKRIPSGTTKDGSDEPLLPVKFQLGEEILIFPDGVENPNQQQQQRSTLVPRSIMRQRMNTFSHTTQPGIKVSEDEVSCEGNLRRSRIRHPTFSEETHNRHNTHIAQVRKLGLKLTIPETSPEHSTFAEFEPRHGSVTAPVRSAENDGRRTFSFGAVAMPGRMTRKITRQMTISGDSAYSTGGVNSRLMRAISRTFTLGSMTDGSSSTIQIEEWRPIFDKFDLEADGRHDGRIPVSRFQAILEGDPIWKESVPQTLKDRIIKEVDINQDGVIDYEEFLLLVRGKHLGLGTRRRRAFRQLLRETVEFIIPYKYTYQNEYKCSPPPLFMLCLSFLQTVIFIYNSYQEIGDIGLYEPVPYCSHLIYNPNQRIQIWRFLSYSLIHSGLFHVSFNVIIQLMLGVPLEMVNGWWRVAVVYISGVLAGSLWTSIIKPGVFLSGGSGGVYALIMSHLATVIMNYREMPHPLLRVGIILVVALTDILVYLYDTVILGEPGKPISYPAHVAGAIAGLFSGVLCLKNLSWEFFQRVAWWICLVLSIVLSLIALVWNMADQSHFVKLTISFNCSDNKVII